MSSKRERENERNEFFDKVLPDGVIKIKMLAVNERSQMAFV
jgi:hypothetical protein